MNNAAFLLIAIGLSVVGSVLIWALNRKPKTFMSSIDDFSREMKALGGDVDTGPVARRRARQAEPPGRESDEFDPTEERRS
jgi:hypothetical protein